MFVAAAVQMEVRLGMVGHNLSRIMERMDEAAGRGATLVVFPESALAGYCFESLEEARPFTQTLSSPEFSQLAVHCGRTGQQIVVGYLEADGERVFNSAVCVGKKGILGNYRKVHLPFLGIDRFTTAGNGLPIFDTAICRLGINICYDSAFPESMRVLMLGGADVIALPTNWPPTSGRTADLIPPARALENNVYVIAANRVGNERGFAFVGKSSICSPRGECLARAVGDEETILDAEIDPQLARTKHLINIPGIHEVDRLKDRRPELYRPLSE